MYCGKMTDFYQVIIRFCHQILQAIICILIHNNTATFILIYTKYTPQDESLTKLVIFHSVC